MLADIKRQFAPREINDESLLLKSLAAKKSRDWDTAIDTWKLMLKSGRFGCLPHVELAKHHEHRLKDYKSALNLTLAALKYIEFEQEFVSPAAYQNQLEALKRRHRRLLKKLDSS